MSRSASVRSVAEPRRPAAAGRIVAAFALLLTLLVSAPAAQAQTATQAGPIAAISGGCDVLADGRVVCGGDGHRGTGVAQRKLSEATLAERTFVRGLTDAKRVAGGSDRCALREGGKLSCWGDNLYPGPLRFAGTSEVVEPVAVPGIVGAVDLAVSNHACVVMADGELRCWGADDYGQASAQIPGGGLDVPVRTIAEPTKVAGVPPAADVTVTSGFTCIAATDATVWCWGTNTLYGRLGHGTTYGSDFRGGPLKVPGLTDVVEVEAAGTKVCARRTAGDVWCWGRFSWRAPDLTSSEIVDRLFATPAQVAGVSGAVELEVGASSACARLSSGRVRCWGDNSLGQLGALARRSEAGLEVRDLTDAIALSDAGERPCVLRATGDVACWGSFASVDAKDPAERETSTAIAVPARGITDAQDLGVGASHWCALLADSTARCAGVDMAGPREEQPGVDGLGAQAATNPNLGPVTQQVTGPGYSCFLTAAQARCFGLANTLDQAVQTYNTGGAGALGGIAELAGGERHVCARTTDARVWCWGDNDAGQVGAGPPGTGPLGTAAQRPTTQVIDLVAAGNRSCVLRTGGSVICWGAASGADDADSVAENEVALPAAATALEAVGGRTCATFAALPRSCWGPIAPDFKRLATCTLQAGEVRCIGDGASGMLGTGSERFTSSRSVPVIRKTTAITVEVPIAEVPKPPVATPGPVATPTPAPAASQITPKPRPATLRSAAAKRKGTLVTFSLILARGDSACSGTVRATLTIGKRKVTGRGRLGAATGDTCQAKVRLRVPRKARGTARVRWSAPGFDATVPVRR